MSAVMTSDTPEKLITLAHGSGGKAMRDLIADVFVRHFGFADPLHQEDQARIPMESLANAGDRLAFTTDSFVVDPLFFQGGDIGKLAVCGTVNDLAVGGAIPLYLTCSVIVEEGLPVSTLERVVRSMKAAADQAGVAICTGDTKVVPKGCADKLFINTAGIGSIPSNIRWSAEQCQPGDLILINGFIGDHGATIADARKNMGLDYDLSSDCMALNGLINNVSEICPEVRGMRDVTRGGLATVLNEFAQAANVGMCLEEQKLPVREEVRGFCELLGLDPLYLANEGKFVAILPRESGENVLTALRSQPGGENAAIIGEVVASPAKRVILQTNFGGQRLVDMLVGDQLPRIC